MFNYAKLDALIHFYLDQLMFNYSLAGPITTVKQRKWEHWKTSRS